MIINRHNYEEFFLLYVDKELEADAQAAVENFVKQNPDLARELEMLQQAILIDDSIQFDQKELLYKQENSICLANYEEYFLLSADNELNEQQAAEVESFVLKNPQLQNEFTLLQQTRLQPEVISFAGKENLYHKEKKGIRIISLAFVRMGAAAAIAGIVYISFIVINKNEISPEKIVITASPKPEETLKNNNDNNIVQKSVTEKGVVSLNERKENRTDANYSTVNTRKQEKDNNSKFTKIKIQAATVHVEKIKNKKETQIPSQNIAVSETTPPNSTQVDTEKKLANLDDNSKPDLINHDGKNNVMINGLLVKEDQPLVTRAVYLETDHDDEEKSVYIGSVGINKNKLKGLLKKAAVFVDKKMRRDDN